MSDLTTLNLQQTISGLQNKQFTASELVQQYINNINKNQHLNAYITTNFDSALQQAKIADNNIANNKSRRLEGIPVAIKDLFCTKNLRTTCASKMLENFIPPYESTVTQKLLDEGAIFLGKTNMDEFAMGSTNTTSCFGKVINPYRSKNGSDLTPGGSSGGSACAVAANLCVFATGSDTGGSIRQPASFTNTVGIKPTYGRSSRYGMIAFASSLDQAGIIAKTVFDAALAQTIISGYDNQDSTSVNIEVPDFSKLLNSNLKGKKIGIPKEYRVDNMPTAIEKIWQKGIDLVKSQGAEIIEISLPHTQYAAAVYYVLAPAECSSNLARFDGVRYGYRADQPNLNLDDLYKQSRSQGFGDEVKKRIIVGTFALSSGYYDAYYKKAQQVRQLILQDFLTAFNKVDAILTPSTPNAAFSFEEMNNFSSIQIYLNDIFTVPANLAGLPAISVPAGFNEDGLPLGLQIISPHFNEQIAFDIALAIEQQQ
jgi:aspartyl-tRNA(Asn)/glutamyl-tRNA(Gln) amidotransferase subunit A